LFDGLGTVYNYRLLKSDAQLAQAQSRLQIENVVIQIINAFYGLAVAQENSLVLKEAYDISKERLERNKGLAEFGQASGLRILNAEVNVNSDSMNWLNAQLNEQTLAHHLNYLLGQSPSQPITVDVETDIDQSLDQEGLKEEAMGYNASLLAATHNQENAALSMRIAQSAQLPRITANLSYGLSRQVNEVGILRVNQNLGLTAGLGVSYNIFDGRQKQIRIQNAQLRMENARLSKEEAMLAVERDFMNAFATYQNNLQLLEIGGINLGTAQKNFDRTKENFQLAQATGLEYREAQLNLIQAKQNILQMRFNAKMAELEVLRIAGRLLNEKK